MSIVLHDAVLDADCYKVRLMLSVLDLLYETVAVDVSGPTSPAFRSLDSRGPVLVDDGHVLREAEAILAYLARRYDPLGRWLPVGDAVLFGETMGWMFFAADALKPAALARLEAMFDVELDREAALQAAKAGFRIMEDHMTVREYDGGTWFVGATATAADIALFPAIALSRDAGIEHDAYPALRRWMRRLRALPGFRTMPGIPDYH